METATSRRERIVGAARLDEGRIREVRIEDWGRNRAFAQRRGSHERGERYHIEGNRSEHNWVPWLIEQSSTSLLYTSRAKRLLSKMKRAWLSLATSD